MSSNGWESYYRLRLANGRAWHLLTTKASEPWIAQVAAAMRLKRRDLQDLVARAGRMPPLPDRLKSFEAAMKESGQHIRHRALLMKAMGKGTYLISSVDRARRRTLNAERVWESFFPFYADLLDSGGLPIHAALIRKRDRCVAIAAKGRTGKSTCCRRLPYPWQEICDDEIVVVPAGDFCYHAHPFPTWSDLTERGLRKSWKVEKSFPLSALYFLEQGNEDQATVVGKAEAIALLWPRARDKCPFHAWGLARQRERAVRLKVFENAQKLARGVVTYRLTARLDGRFWEEIERALQRDVACSLVGSRDSIG